MRSMTMEGHRTERSWRLGIVRFQNCCQIMSRRGDAVYYSLFTPDSCCMLCFIADLY